MPSASAIAGIQQYGLGWKAQINLSIPDDIPAKIKDLETTPEVNRFVDATVSTIYKQLVSYAKSSKLPPDSLTRLNDILDEVAEYLLNDDFDPDTDSDPILDAEVVEGKVEDLLYFLNDLYDWADYHRVLISKSPHMSMVGL